MHIVQIRHVNYVQVFIFIAFRALEILHQIKPFVINAML